MDLTHTDIRLIAFDLDGTLLNAAKELTPRNRSNRPDFERKLAFVAPEERALMPQSMDEHALKLAMGLLE